MARQTRSSWRSATHTIERGFDALRARPLGIAVFLASAALLLYMQVQTQGAIRAEAVARAQQVDHPAHVSSFVTTVYVHAGDIISGPQWEALRGVATRAKELYAADEIISDAALRIERAYMMKAVHR